ncbi:MAG: hypothetical protein ACLRWP_19175 [Bilophila wadsworthia]
MTAIHIQGLGTYVPTKRITNVDLMSLVDTNDEWIVSRTGIKARHMLADDENGSDAGTEAALKALEDAGIAAEDITHVLTATCTPDYLCPSTACIISGKSARTGRWRSTSTACTGFVYGLDVANSILVESSGLKSCSWARSLYPPPELGRPHDLHPAGDGAAAAVLTTATPGRPSGAPSAPASGMSGAVRTGGNIPCYRRRRDEPQLQARRSGSGRFLPPDAGA